jgi:thiosulfate dehydrogenase
MKTFKSHWFLFLLLLTVAVVGAVEVIDATKNSSSTQAAADSTWVPPSLFSDNQTKGEERKLIMYGEELIAHTARYLGPKGSVAQITNGMNCQNCHLEAGRRPWGNNYSAVYATYPKLRARSGQVEGIYKRVNDCFQRSLNGEPLDTASHEMQAIYAYLKWVGQDVPKGKKPYSAGLPSLPYMDRAADPEKGRQVYISLCQSCHGADGEGVLNPNGITYAYPPLWGPNSYNDGAGLYRISRFATFAKYNMPYNQAFYNNPMLTDEQAWDVAAFVNSQPRPHVDQSGDWPDISKKSIDEPFGPYSDTFSERQHKYGPYKPIENAKKQQTKSL